MHLHRTTIVNITVGVKHTKSNLDNSPDKLLQQAKLSTTSSTE